MPSPGEGEPARVRPRLLSRSCIAWSDLLEKYGDRSRRFSSSPRALRIRRHHRHHERRRRPPGRTHRQRLRVAVARASPRAGLRRSQGSELSGTEGQPGVRGERAQHRPRGDVAPLRVHAARQVRRRRLSDERTRLAAAGWRPRPHRVRHGHPARRGRPHHLRGPGGSRGHRRRRAAALPPRQVQTFRGRLGVTIPLARPPVDDEVKEAVLAAMEGRQYILGPQCKEFESELARHAGVKHAVLTSSATAALWMIMRGLGVKAGDEILAPSHTAFPTIEAICFAGATPVFVDADDWFTMDPKDAAARITPRTVGIVPVHLYGQPVDVPAIQDVASAPTPGGAPGFRRGPDPPAPPPLPGPAPRSVPRGPEGAPPPAPHAPGRPWGRFFFGGPRRPPRLPGGGPRPGAGGCWGLARGPRAGGRCHVLDSWHVDGL